MTAPENKAAEWSLRDLLLSREVLSALLIEILIALILAAGLWQAREQTIEHELATLGALSAAMATQADKTLDVADAVLRATRAELNEGLLVPATRQAHEWLRARASGLLSYRALAVIDEHGMRISTSREDSGPPLPLADRDFFKAAQSSDGASLFIGSPYVSQADRRSSVSVSLAWQDRAGLFRGALLLVADPEFLDGDFQRLAPYPDAGMAIYRADRALVSTGPSRGSAASLPSALIDEWMAAKLAPVPSMVSGGSGEPLLVAARKLRRFPLLVVLSRDRQVVLSRWAQQAWMIGAFAGSALIVTFLLTLRSKRDEWLRKRSQHLLQAEQERAARATQAALEGHWDWDPATGLHALSDRMCDLLGMDEPSRTRAQSEPLNAPLQFGLLHRDDLEPLRARYLEFRNAPQAGFDAVFRVHTGQGSFRHVRARGRLWSDHNGAQTLLTGTAADISVEVQAQQHARSLVERLHRARRLEAIGNLAGAVAHDFNSVLTAVIGHAELAAESPRLDEAARAHLERILTAGDRGRRLVARILSSSQGNRSAHETVELTAIIDEVLGALQATVPAGIRIEPPHDPVTDPIQGDPTMVYEALMNLCNNAIQAMPRGGRMQIGLTRQHLDEARPLVNTVLRPGTYLCLSVSDDGEGIRDGDRDHLFEPFFSARRSSSVVESLAVPVKPSGGTGLGLSIVQTVMNHHRGGIALISAPGQGSRFELLFPLVSATVARAGADSGEPLGSGQVVMVVDDDPYIVALLEDQLAELAYEPAGFVSSQQALEAFSDDPHRFDLLITDEDMPQLRGTELCSRVRSIRPDLPVILYSGYGGDQLDARARLAGIAQVLRKPVRRSELARCLDEALRPAAPLSQHKDGE